MSDPGDILLNDRTVELIHLATDGEATPLEKEELERILATSAEARAAHASLRGLTRQLESMPMADPPPFRDEVLSAIRKRSVEPVSIAAHRPRRRLLAAIAYAAAAVVVITVAVDRLFINQHRTAVPPAQASAAMARLEVEEWPTVARVSFTEATEGVTLTIRRSGDSFALQPTNRGEASISIRWDRDKLALADVSPFVTQSGADPAELTFSSGTKRLLIILRRREGASGTAEVRVFLAGKEVSKASLIVD